MPALSPEDVGDAPELLVLASLDATLMALHVAIIAAHPELLNDFPRQRDPPLLALARRLSDRAHLLGCAMRRYRDELERTRVPTRADSDGLPF